MKKRAFTLVEIIVVVALIPLVILMVWRLMSMITGSGTTSVGTLSRRSLLAQTSVLAIEKLYNRLQEGIEILEPRPGESGDELVFHDILNHKVTLKMHPTRENTLVSFCEANGTDDPETGAGCPSHEVTPEGDEGNPFYPAPPIRIDNVKSVKFTPQSPVCVRVSIVLADGRVETPLVVMMELKNRGLAYHQ